MASKDDSPEAKAKHAAYMREWNRKNPHKAKEQREKHREKRAARFRQWQLANQEHLRAYKADPDRKARYNAQGAAYKRANPQQRLQYENERRARMLGNGYERVDYSEIEARDKGICGICHEAIIDEKVIFDHIQPLSKGGSHTFDNIQSAHWICNARKGNRILEAA